MNLGNGLLGRRKWVGRLNTLGELKSRKGLDLGGSIDQGGPSGVLGGSRVLVMPVQSCGSVL